MGAGTLLGTRGPAAWWGMGMLLALLVGCEAAPVLKAGDPAPPFELERAEGGKVALRDASGHPLVIRFWADWCPFCRPEMRALERLSQQHRQQGLVILAVNAGQDGETVRRFMAELGATYPALLDPDSQVARRYGVVGLPTSFFVNRDGRIRSKLMGEIDENTMARLLDELVTAAP